MRGHRAPSSFCAAWTHVHREVGEAGRSQALRSDRYQPSVARRRLGPHMDAVSLKTRPGVQGGASEDVADEVAARGGEANRWMILGWELQAVSPVL